MFHGNSISVWHQRKDIGPRVISGLSRRLFSPSLEHQPVSAVTVWPKSGWSNLLPFWCSRTALGTWWSLSQELSMALQTLATSLIPSLCSLAGLFSYDFFSGSPWDMVAWMDTATLIYESLRIP